MPTKTMNGHKTAVKPPVEPPIPETKEGILAEVLLLCDLFDERMKGPLVGESLHIERPRTGSEWWNLRERMRKLDYALDNVLPADGEIVSDDVISQHIQVEPGLIPPWSRVGTFLIWMGKIPFRCVWGGFPCPCAMLYAADPGLPFPTATGELHGHTMIQRPDRSPADVLMGDLLEMSNSTTWHKNKQVPTFKLVPLLPETRAEVAAYREQNEWIRKALARGPVDALPMPRHLQAVAMSLTF